MRVLGCKGEGKGGGLFLIFVVLVESLGVR